MPRRTEKKKSKDDDETPTNPFRAAVETLVDAINRGDDIARPLADALDAPPASVATAEPLDRMATCPICGSIRTTPVCGIDGHRFEAN